MCVCVCVWGGGGGGGELRGMVFVLALFLTGIGISQICWGRFYDIKPREKTFKDKDPPK